VLGAPAETQPPPTPRSSAGSQALGCGTGQPERTSLSPLLSKSCPKGWVKVGFGAKASGGDQKRSSLKLSIANTNIPVQTNLEIVERGPS